MHISLTDTVDRTRDYIMSLAVFLRLRGQLKSSSDLTRKNAIQDLQSIIRLYNDNSIPDDKFKVSDSRIIASKASWMDLQQSIIANPGIIKGVVDRNDHSIARWDINAIVQDPFSFWCGSDEYKIRLITTFLAHISGDYRGSIGSIVEHENYFSTHYKRGARYFVRNHIIGDKSPGRLNSAFKSKENVVNFLDPAILSSRFSIDERGKFCLNIGDCADKLDFAAYEDRASENGVVLDRGTNILSGDFREWNCFIQSLLNDDILERNLVNHQNSRIKADLMGRIWVDDDHIGLKAIGIDAEHSDNDVLNHNDVKSALKSFRDGVLCDENFIKKYTGGNGVLKTQQYFRYLANKVNIHISLLDNGSLIYRDRWEDTFMDLATDINELLVIYDLFYEKRSFGYHKKIAYFTDFELCKIFDYLKKFPDSSGDGLHEFKRCKDSDTQAIIERFHFSSEAENEFHALLEFTKSKSSYHEDKDEYLRLLSSINQNKVQSSVSLSIRDRVASFVKYIPLVGDIVSNYIHPSKARYGDDHSNALNLGCEFSSKIRVGLGLRVEDFKNLHIKDARVFLNAHRVKHRLVGNKEYLELKLLNNRDSLRCLFYMGFLSLTISYILVVALSHRARRKIFDPLLFINVLQACDDAGLTGNRRLLCWIASSLVALFAAVFLLYVFEVIVGHIIRGIFACIVTSLKFVDQFVFGRLFAKIINIIIKSFSSIVEEMKDFIEEVVNNISEHGFVDGIHKTFAEAEFTEFLLSLPSRSYVFLCKNWRSCDVKENIMIPSTWSFSIFDPVGSFKKVCNIYSETQHDHIAGSLDELLKIVHSDNKKRSFGDILCLHSAFIEVNMSKHSHESLFLEFNKFYHSDRGRDLKQKFLSDRVFKNSFDDKSNFCPRKYQESIAVFRAATNLGIDTDRDFRLIIKDLCGDDRNHMITKRIDAIHNALIKIAGPFDGCIYDNSKSDIHFSLRKRERAFELTAIHRKVENGLMTYKSLLENYPNLTDDALKQFDALFSKQLSNALQILRISDYVHNHYVMSESLGRFINAFDAPIVLMKHDREEVENILLAMSSYYGNSFSMKFFEDGFCDLLKGFFSFSGCVSIILGNVVPVDLCLLKVEKIGEVMGFDALRDLLASHPKTRSILSTLHQGEFKEQLEYLECISDVVVDDDFKNVCKEKIRRSYHNSEKCAKGFLNDILRFVFCALILPDFIDDFIQYYRNRKYPPGSNVNDVILQDHDVQASII